MIIAKTKLKKIPDKCIKCRFCINVGVSEKSNKLNNYIAVTYTQKRCSLTGAEVPYVYNKSKRNWEYTKCDNCPLRYEV